MALEFDRALLPALGEVVGSLPNVRVVASDALTLEWDRVLGPGEATMVSNLPYNIAVPLLLRMLEAAPEVRRYLVMVQREVGDRLVAPPGSEAYGAVSVKVAYRAEGRLMRRVPAAVFWPSPSVESVIVSLRRRDEPAVDVDERALFRVVDEGFAERRKTMTNALRRLGLEASAAAAVMRATGLDPKARAEEIDLEGFARLAAALLAQGALEAGR